MSGEDALNKAQDSTNRDHGNAAALLQAWVPPTDRVGDMVRNVDPLLGRTCERWSTILA